tara:strand:+ start:330 stop:572 length:243 start_codon:yes stop_codon:yes gene_type:complete
LFVPLEGVYNTQRKILNDWNCEAKALKGEIFNRKNLWKNKKATFYIIRRAIIVARQTLIPSMMMDTLIVSRVIQQQEEMI